MRSLPLYDNKKVPSTPVETTEPVDRESLPKVGHQGRACTRCTLGETGRAKNPCLPAEGEAGGLLVIGEWPNAEEDGMGLPVSGFSGRMLRPMVKKHWQGPVAYDLAIRCTHGREEVKTKHVDACNAFLSGTLQEVQPTRIVALGPWAAYALLGRVIQPMITRRAQGWISGARSGGKPIPVFVVMSPFGCRSNRFLRAMLEEDMEWALTTQAQEAPWTSDVRVVETEEDALVAERELSDAAWVAFDVETVGTMWDKDFRIICTALCADGTDAPWVWPTDAMDDPKTLEPLRRLLTSREVAKAGQNVKYDQLAFRAAYGWQVRPIVLDTRLQRKLQEPEADGSLAAMSELVGMGGLKEEAGDAMTRNAGKVRRALAKSHPDDDGPLVADLPLSPKLEKRLRAGANQDTHRYWMMPEDTLIRYNARDAVATARLGVYQADSIQKEPDLLRTWKKIVRPASVALERIEAWGMPVSKDAILAFDQYLGVKEVEAKAVLDQYGADTNWNSTPQIGALLYGTLGLKPPRMTDAGKPSTDADALEELSKHHPLPKALLDYRKVMKLRGTYASGMLEHVRPDGRIHPNVKLDGARSGRTSCTQPNLQNIPRAQSIEGKMARDCFAARPGFTILECDYSQLELRIAAALSGDPEMRGIFEAGVDYHLRTAQLVSQTAWGIPPEQVEDKHRSQAKGFNFGLLYGQGDSALAQNIGCTVQQAGRIREAILGKFSVLARWIQEMLQYATKYGHAWTWWDGGRARRRPLWRIADDGDAGASVARNSAHNTPIQGTASDFCIASLVECVRWIEGDNLENDVKLCLPVHDALLFEVRTEMLPEVHANVMRIMQGWNSNGVPLIADAKAGPSWGSLEKYPPKEKK